MSNLNLFRTAPPPAGYVPTPVERWVADLPRLAAQLDTYPVRNTDLLKSLLAAADSLPPEVASSIHQAAQRAPRAALEEFLLRLVSAWPNASQNDLAGYGAQLSQDVEQARPTRFALKEGSRRLRRNCKFLPSISEVLDAIAAAEKQLLPAVRALTALPEQIRLTEETVRREIARQEEDAPPSIPPGEWLARELIDRDQADPTFDFGGGCMVPLSNIKACHARGLWAAQWGAKLGEDGCRIPRRYWAELRAAEAPQS